MPFNEPECIASDLSNHIVFDTLVSFLNKSSSDPGNSKDYVADTTAKLSSAGTQNPSLKQYRTESRYLFAVLLSLVQQLDANAPEQDHLVRLVLALRDVPLPLSVTQQMDPRALENDNMNRKLSNFINVWAAIGRDAPLHPRLEDRPEHLELHSHRLPWRQEPGQYLSSASWTSMNAFLARLHAAAPDVPTLDFRALLAMMEALEQPLTPAELEDALPPAAYWVLHAGINLKHNDIPYASYDYNPGNNRSVWSKGVLWDGQHAFNPARWEFWLQRFKAIADRPENTEEVRDLALRAFEVGSSLE